MALSRSVDVGVSTAAPNLSSCLSHFRAQGLMFQMFGASHDRYPMPGKNLASMKEDDGRDNRR